ncbi:MAG: hypothetical protein P8N02_18510, partial [Actinomycetota bacterium]|nr:hypothetical protein [Actinomycetota bacterium]
LDHSVYFDPDETESAMDELDRLYAARSGGEAPSNRCAEVLGELLSRISPEDWSPYETLVSPEVVREDRRSGLTAPIVTNRDQMIENQVAMFEVGFAAPSFEPIEVRGDHLMLSRVLWDSGGGQNIPMLVVARIDTDDCLDRVVFFDSDDHEGARAELDRLASEQRRVEPSNRAAQLFRRFSEEVGPDNLSLIEEMYSDDYLRVDHRGGMPFPPADRAGQVEAVAAL